MEVELNDTVLRVALNGEEILLRNPQALANGVQVNGSVPAGLNAKRDV